MRAEFPESCWRKSSRSNGNGGDCVEIALGSTAVGIRDSKDRSGPWLRVGARQWTSFLDALRDAQR